MARVIICGSRTWADENRVKQEICSLVSFIGDVTIVHGDCPTGADAAARKWAASRGATEERHPADWKRHGRAAGPIRNQQMADAGADLCLAYCNGLTRGTYDMMSRARAAGIKVKMLDSQNSAAGWQDWEPASAPTAPSPSEPPKQSGK